MQAASVTFNGTSLAITEQGGGAFGINIVGDLLGNVPVFSVTNQDTTVNFVGVGYSTIYHAAGDWQANGNWQSGSPPPASADVTVNAQSTLTAQAAISVHDLWVNSSSLTFNAGLSASDAVTVSATSAITVAGGPFTAPALTGTNLGLGAAPVVNLHDGGAIGSVSNVDIRLYAGTLEITSGAASSILEFRGPSATLQLDAPAGVTGSSITGVVLGDVIDLRGVAAAAAYYNGETLTVLKAGGGTLFFAVSGDLAADHVNFASDGHGGTNLFWTSGASPPPPAPTNLADAGILHGYVNAANDTAAQALTGVAQAGAAVTVYDGVHALGSTTADGLGNWSFTLGHLGDGAHSLTATATNSGGTSPASGPLAFVVDTVAPVPDVTYLNRAGSNWTLVGHSEPGRLVKIFDNGVQITAPTANASGIWAVTVPLDPNTLHRFTEQATDAAGNVGVSTGQTLFSLTGAHLIGGAGPDVLVAFGDDVLTGGAGQDRFVVDAAFATQRIITDFTPATPGHPGDLLELDAAAYHNFAWVMANATQHGPNTVITVHGASLTLQNVTLTSLHSGDFIFV
jgi:hypothetical protein